MANLILITENIKGAVSNESILNVDSISRIIAIRGNACEIYFIGEEKPATIHLPYADLKKLLGL